jgi:phytoene synthase
MRVLTEVVERYGIPRQELEALISGVQMDSAVTRYATWEELRSYCRLVASTVGRMCVRIFGYTDPVALERADELGVAMQLANVLRDVREDYAMGRVYLPQDELRACGVPESALEAGQPAAGWEALMRFQIERAQGLFASGLRVTEAIPRRASACVLTMAGIYQALVAEMERDPYLPLRQRASLPPKKKLSVMLRSWLDAVSQ